MKRTAPCRTGVYLMEDCTSPVVIPVVIDYTDQADEAFRRFAEASMHLSPIHRPHRNLARNIHRRPHRVPRMRLAYFFYGTLMDSEVLRTVIGRSIPPSNRRPAVIGGYRRVYRVGAWYPILIADTESEVEGILVTKLTVADAVRLAIFGGP